MRYATKKFLKTDKPDVALNYRLAPRIDYLILSQYILRINQQKEVDAILREVSHCLKDILDYELFGFALVKGSSMDLWIDPHVYSADFSEYVQKDFGSQKIDFTVRCFDKKLATHRHNIDSINLKNVISFKVLDGNFIARLYILPKRKMLRHHDTIINIIINSISIALEKNLSIEQLENAAAIDPLTKCYNRRALGPFLENAIAYSHRYNNDLTVIMFDMDNFKAINDMHGHLAGDAVLKEVATLVRTLVRRSDYFVRYGGEEFLLVLPDTELFNAVQLADKIRREIASHPIKIGELSLTVSASFGVGSLGDKQEYESLLDEADSRLYKAKAMGKNRVVPGLLSCVADGKFDAGAISPKCTLVQIA